MRYPEFLDKGGTIGFIAPSFGCTIEPYKSCFENAKLTFEKMGYKIFEGENCHKSDGIGISSTPQNCGKELTDAYAGDDCDCIISCGGGELMCEILPFVDFGKIKAAAPKWYLGYSDNTNFTFTSTILADTAALYGPCAPTFGMEKWHKALKDTWDVLTGETLSVKGYDSWELQSLKSEDNPLAQYNLTEAKRLVLMNGSEKTGETEMKGRLIGGCLDTLLTLIGTEYDKVADFIGKYKDDGIIWFLEACDLSVFQIRRGLWQMKKAGWFKHCRGFIFGRPMHFDEPAMGLDRHLAVMAHLEELNVPVIMDADIGHLPPSMPVISGAVAHIQAQNDDIIIDYILE